MSYIRLNNVTLRFPIYRGNHRSLKRALLNPDLRKNLVGGKNKMVTAVALNDLTLAVENGDRLAVIGPNGAGKTTLLKLLAGIYEAQEGALEVSGTVRALLSPSFGLDLDATGRENVALLGAYMRIHPRDMVQYVEEIGEWTELGAHFDTPVRGYSSGMRVRLCFATFTCVAPECLLLDEWLSAGDARFIERAHQRVSKMAHGSDIMVAASHSIEFLEKFCNRAILLEGGRIHASGSVSEVAEIYRRRQDSRNDG